MRSVLFNRLLPVIMLAGICAGNGFGAVSAQAPDTSTIEGNWKGMLDQQPDKPVVVDIRRGTGGRLLGSITFGESNSEFTIDAVERNGTMVRLVVGEAGGGFEGVLSNDGAKLTGAWSELAIATPLELIRSPTHPLSTSPPK